MPTTETPTAPAQAPPTPEPGARVRVLESPSVAWAMAENAKVGRGERRTEAKPFSGEVLGIPIVAGIARVDESKTMRVQRAVAGDWVEEPLWHQFVTVLHFTDITPAEQPPAQPLPGWKPYRGTATANPTPNRLPTRVIIRPDDAT